MIVAERGLGSKIRVMSESPSSTLPRPFYSTDEVKVGKSARRNVYNPVNTEIVVKTRKQELSPRFDSSIEALEKISEARKDQESVRVQMARAGITADTLPSSSFVIHEGQNTGVEFSEVQKHVEGVTLKNTGRRLLNLPKSELRSLANIFMASIKYYNETGKLIDIVGSPAYPYKGAGKILKHLLPLFYSENIMVCENNQIRFVDTGLLSKESVPGWRYRISSKLQLAGNYISLGILKGVLTFRSSFSF